MYIDKALILADSQSLTVSGASTNYIDTLAPGAAYDAPFFVVLIKTSCTAAGGATVAFDLRADSSNAFGTEVVMFTTGAVAIATLVAGYFAAKVRIPIDHRRQFLRGYVTIATGPLTAGAWDMKIVEDVDVLLP